ncbi:MAG TPA: hypothetical protein VNH11_28700 [Pirellulales bacterium]|nr:hypothetical protein [Pirellulales bacterium]
MQKISMDQLSEPVRLFLSQVPKTGGVLVEDERGRVCFGVIPYQEAPASEQQAARVRLATLQQRVGERLQAQGKSQEELDRLLQDDE